jgi:two-component system nitrate/nitrite response regulator NarL
MRGRVDEDVHHDDVPLSNGELTLLELLVQGAANKVIARKLDIAEGTVKIRLLFLMRKLRVNNRTQAAIWAVQHGKCPRPQLLPPVGSEAA